MRFPRIWQNLQLLILGTLHCLLCCCLSIAMTLLVGDDNPDRYIINAMMISLGIGMLIAWMMCLPRVYAYFQIKDGELIFKRAFRNPVKKPLGKYRYIYRAYYEHGNTGCFSYYIVISTVWLRSELLSNINQVPSTPDTIKIKYTDKKYKMLFVYLDEKQQEKLKAAFNK